MNDNLSMEIAAWLQGVGTVAAVVVALFLELFLVWWRRPRFEFKVSLDSHERDLVPASRPEHDQYICWLRGRLYVKDGKKPAMNTEVIVRDWRSPGRQDVPFAHGNTLHWANTEDKVTRIAPGTWRRVDLLAWMAPIDRTGPPTLWIALQDARGHPPRPWYHVNLAGNYELDLVVIADNSNASHWRLKFTYLPTPVESLEDLQALVTRVELTRAR